MIQSAVGAVRPDRRHRPVRAGSGHESVLRIFIAADSRLRCDVDEEHPGEPVPLIVQHDGTPDDLLAFVRESGVVVEREFHIVPAIDIEVPASVINRLAGQNDVEWISLDAPVQSTDAGGGGGVTVALIDTGVSDDVQENFYDTFDTAGSARSDPPANARSNAAANDRSSTAANVRVQWVSARPELSATEDGFGHGSHVGGVIRRLLERDQPDRQIHLHRAGGQHPVGAHRR